MDENIRARILECTGARSVARKDFIQSLWSGYGEIFRVALKGAEHSTAVVKRVAPKGGAHPRGWNTTQSHDRKLRSYEVELAWYRHWAGQCVLSRVPLCFGAWSTEEGWIFVLEDLDAAGFSKRRVQLSEQNIEQCLVWLAGFHAHFISVQADDLWEVGTYWHLATRPDEFAAMEDPELKAAASAIDARLSHCRFPTLVHGDAKAANFCFADDARSVAAVDFQYVGGGCGIKDVAYFFSSCMSPDDCEGRAAHYLERYFVHLRAALERLDHPIDFEALREEWSSLYPFAWADFSRFLAGWSPGHWKLHRYSARMTQQAIAAL